LTGGSVSKYPPTEDKRLDQKILSELGDYLLAHRDEIVAEWLRAVEQNPDIISFDHLKGKKELLDHLPELCPKSHQSLKLAAGGRPCGSA
jgi:hypothetical protein